MERELRRIRQHLDNFQNFIHRIGNQIDYLRIRHSGHGKRITLIKPLRMSNIPTDIPNTRIGNVHCIEIIRSRHHTRRIVLENYFDENELNEVREIAQDCVHYLDEAESSLGRIDNLTEVVRMADPEYTMDITSLYDIITTLDVLDLVS